LSYTVSIAYIINIKASEKRVVEERQRGRGRKQE
jgi:hypothetical protein